MANFHPLTTMSILLPLFSYFLLFWPNCSNANGPTYPMEIPLGIQQIKEGQNIPPIITRSKNECAAAAFNSTESFVCVCNGTYCDQPEDVGKLQPGKAVLFISDPAKYRLNRSEVELEMAERSKEKGDDNSSSSSSVHIVVDASRQFQTLLGFGGAFTDAAGYNLNMLSEKARMNLLRAYYDKTNGIAYTLGRVPIASCDFSTRVYSYCDTPGDFNLKTFALAKEDLEMKIPHIRTAIELSQGKLKLFGTPWSAPGWMKTTGKMQGGGSLRGTLQGPYYKTYANYFRRFFEEYLNKGNISFWGLTIENEPYCGRIPGYAFQAMWISPDMQRDFANQLLAPTLKQSPASANVLIMGHDHNLDSIFEATETIFKGTSPGGGGLNSSIAGIAYHWYADYANPNKSIISKLHELHPDRFFLSTEACTGWTGPSTDRGPSLGSWTRAQMYGRDVMRSLQNWAVGWTDWNICLDQQGGPNWVNNFVDAPVIINAEKDEFYKQPMFYALGHFSRFIPPGSVRIDSQLKFEQPNSSADPSAEFVAFRTGNGDRVLVIMSNSNEPIEVILEEEKQSDGKGAMNGQFQFTLPPNAFGTILWSKSKGK